VTASGECTGLRALAGGEQLCRPRRGAGIPTSRRRAVGGWVERGGGGQASGECVCLPALTLVDQLASEEGCRRLWCCCWRSSS
jgi:hypothetical protein